MDLDQSTADSTTRLYGLANPDLGTTHVHYLLCAEDLQSHRSNSEASDTGGINREVQLYEECVGKVYKFVTTLAQSDRSPPGQAQHGITPEVVLHKYDSHCRITCLLPAVFWDLVSMICILGTREKTPRAHSIAGHESNEYSPWRRDDLLPLSDSTLWNHILYLRGSNPAPQITLFDGDEDKPLEDFVRGITALTIQERAKNPPAGSWIERTAVWDLCQAEHNGEGEGDGLNEHQPQRDADAAAHARQRAVTDPPPRPQSDYEYTWAATQKQKQHQGFRSLRDATPRTMPKADSLFSTPRGAANGTFARCFD